MITGEVGTNAETTKDEIIKPAAGAPEEQKAPGDTIEKPSFGVDEKGYFFLQAHMSMGCGQLLGVLLEASDFLRETHPGSIKNRILKAKDKEIIQPQRGFRGFNIFNKGK